MNVMSVWSVLHLPKAYLNFYGLALILALVSTTKIHAADMGPSEFSLSSSSNVFVDPQAGALNGMSEVSSRNSTMRSGAALRQENREKLSGPGSSYIEIRQVGKDNTIEATQSGRDTLTANQGGSGNRLIISQGGETNANILQFGNNNTANVQLITGGGSVELRQAGARQVTITQY